MMRSKCFSILSVVFVFLAVTFSSTSVAQSMRHEFEGNAAELFGSSVSGAGDVNGDGFDDLIVGASEGSSSVLYSGYARVFSGFDGRLLWQFDGDDWGDGMGVSVSSAGDVNADGFGDVIVGAWKNGLNGVNSGSAYVFSGIDGSTLFAFHGNSMFDFFGSSVSGAGDVNGDGFDDVIVGAPSFFSFGPNPGSARVFSGFDGSVLHAFIGTDLRDRLGVSVSGAGMSTEMDSTM